MDFDAGTLIGLIGIVAGAGVLGLSYVGAYMVGHRRGRRDAERERALAREEAQSAGADRLLVVEGAVDSVARAIERLAEAQRLSMLDPGRAPTPLEAPLGSRRVKHDTPA